MSKSREQALGRDVEIVPGLAPRDRPGEKLRDREKAALRKAGFEDGAGRFVTAIQHAPGLGRKVFGHQGAL